MAWPLPATAHAGGDQAAGLRRLMARPLGASTPSADARNSPRLEVAVLAQHPALADWMHQQLSAVLASSHPCNRSARAGRLHLREVALTRSLQLGESACQEALADCRLGLLAVPASAHALPESLTWAYAQIKRLHGLDAARCAQTTSRLHLVLVGVQLASQGQQALANLAAAAQRHLGVFLPPASMLRHAYPAAADPAHQHHQAQADQVALEFCRLAAELSSWSAVPQARKA